MAPVIVTVDSLPPEGRTVTLSLPPEEVDRYFLEIGLRGVRALEPVAGEMRLLPSGADVFVLGRLRGRVEYPCDRCLEPFAEAVDEAIHVTLAREEEAAGPEVELRREDLEVDVLHQGTVNLTALLLEHLQLALRDHPVCRPECRGLCQSCGADLNRGPCGCPAQSAHPSFSALAAWEPKR